MKKMFLSSFRFGNSPRSLLELVEPGVRAAIILNATDIYGNDDRAHQLAINSDTLNSLGIEPEELDLRDFFGRSSDLSPQLGLYGLIWVAGGNTFVLRRAMRQSRFDEIAPTRIHAGELVYGGFSAGAIVATRTLAGIQFVDDPHAVPDGYTPEIIWDGLGLYENSIAPHFRSDHPESSLVDEVVREFEAQNLPYQTIRDGEAILVNGETSTIVGADREV